MGYGKPRHNPDKKANREGGDNSCSYYEREGVCEAGLPAKVCKGNPHSCVKEKYRLLASIPMDNRWKV